MSVQIRAKTTVSRGVFAGIRQCRETTAPVARELRAFLPDRPKRPVTTLTGQVLAGHRGLHYTPAQASEKRVYPSCPPPDIRLAPFSPVLSRGVP
ncbi:hypothetical protein DB771_03955 [Burkholderia sp. AU29985]|nr:hypothetical protein XM57_17215 [Burkholderia cepacia]AYZ96461.1 hypothetical protein EGY28_15005 [Burkholderia dolosa]PRE57552.1 hypothetical protein C6P87_01115 [Burkholderia sp. AU12872]PUA78452.1 hypothetical protein DB771_03955 [Burkholderia sp. AU29985]